MQLPSKVLEQAVEQIAQLPGIGRKTALRLALHLVYSKTPKALNLAKALENLYEGIKFCKICHNLSDSDVCSICSDTKRDTRKICVVEHTSDVIAIENTGQFNGLYHVLGGLITPMDGIGPNDLTIQDLVNRIKSQQTDELFFALSATIEADTTIFYIHKLVKDEIPLISTLSRGIGVGDEIQYTDDVTLARSIAHRVPYQLHN